MTQSPLVVESFGTELVSETPIVSVVGEDDDFVGNSETKGDAMWDTRDDDSIEDSDCEEVANIEEVAETQWDKVEDVANSKKVVEPIASGSLNIPRASQVKGINLMVHLQSTSIRRRIRSQIYEESMSSQESVFVGNSEDLGIQRQLNIDCEFQLTLPAGNRLGWIIRKMML